MELAKDLGKPILRVGLGRVGLRRDLKRFEDVEEGDEVLLEGLVFGFSKTFPISPS